MNSATGNIFTATAYNHRGQIANYTLGNGKTTAKGYDGFGFLTGISTPGIQNLEYNFDTQTGNLNYRKDIPKNLQENFTYDNLMKNRLETWQVTGGSSYSANYHANGNIDTKTGLGEYSYGDNAGPHAVTGVENTGGLVSETGQRIAYTPFNKADTITEGDYRLEIVYGPDDTRKITRLYHNDVLHKTRYFAGGVYEEEKDETTGATTAFNYINAGDGLAAIYTGNSLYYIHKDHLGSCQAVTNSAGALVEELNLDPWGRRRNPTDWTYNNVPSSSLFSRGFTGHEHLPEFNLINMNGRVYDPVLGRFLSPDNYIQAPDYSQSMNRYSYALNNPLVYTDPDGENPFWIALGIYAAYTYFRTAHENRDPETGKWAWNPVDWFDKESTFIAGVNTNTEFSDVTGYVGAGSGYYIPSLSFNNNYGPGFGYWSPQGASFTYPNYNPPSAEDVVGKEIVQTQRDYGQAWHVASRDATLDVPQYYSNSLLQDNTIFGIGDAITIHNEFAPAKYKIPYIDNALMFIETYNHLKIGNYTEATWSLIEGAGGIYSVGFKGLAYGYNTKYMQTEIGRGFYRDYIKNLNLYKMYGDEIYLNNAIEYERLMRTAYDNIQRK